MIKTTDRHAFFYTEWPSNFWKTDFEWECFGERRRFFCTEQAFMWAKAKTFGDDETAEAILSERSDPMTVKSLGRMVKNYDDAKWDEVRYGYMYQVNKARFEQDPKLRRKILDPKYAGLTFVEASPSDRIWGVGMRQDDPAIADPANWKGRNLLGRAITQVRDELAAGK